MIAAALRSALSDRVADGKLFVLESIVTEEPSTRKALQVLSGVGDYTTALVVLHRDEDIAWLSLRNIPNVHAVAVDQINVYDIISNQVIVFTKPALDEFVSRPGDTGDTDDEAEPVKATTTVSAGAPLAVEEPEVVEEPAAAEVLVEDVELSGDGDPALRQDDEGDGDPALGQDDEGPDYGEGSYRGSDPPEGYEIKGNEGSMKFHTPSSQWYKRTVAQVWFNSPEAAIAAGFTDVTEGKK